jgi:ATP-dependent RNA/DNA helicase IGHMBP2
MTSKEHFEQLLQLLNLERADDLREYLRTVREKPLSERVAEGNSWYPVQVVQTGFALGEKAFVVVERTARRDEPHQIRAGQSVNLFTTQEHVKNPEKQGVVHFVERNKMKIILNARDVPEWLSPGPLGVDQLFDDRSYQEMERALNKVMQAKGNRLAEIRDFLRPGKKSENPPETLGNNASSTPNDLNPSQQRAVQAICSTDLVTVVHGPPGTGKTTTLVAAIAELAKTESTVLVTAPSNTAVDLLTERLAGKGLNVVRVGNISRVDESIVQHTLDSILAKHPESKNIRKVKLQAAEYRRQSKRFKRSFNMEDRREREHLKDQARELESWARSLEDRLVEEVLTAAQAITCTLVGAASPILESHTFRTCVIDEAAQALEPATWIPITKCSRVVLAGDPYQLPPTVKSIEAARAGFSRTLMERCLEQVPDQVHLLQVQYRMHHAIMDFSNQYFYAGALQAHDTVRERRLFSLAPDAEMLTVFDPVVFVDTAGTGFEERANKTAVRSQSKYNPEEALLVREHLLQLLDKMPGMENPPSIGVLSPYREQVNCLDKLFQEDARLAPLLQRRETGAHSQLTVNTIDGFQGQERDVVYISLVRSNAKHEIGFLSDYRRMNVAMTRAKKLLVVIGDSATIGKNVFYQKFLDYCAEKGAYQTAWEYMR